MAWEPLGWEAAVYSEIDPFARAVLTIHYPTVPLHGDFTTIQGTEYGPVDALVGGTPCQDFSIAGLRAGVAGERGNLTLEFLRLAARMEPAWIVWENVPGVLSIDGGRTFGAFLGGLAELGYGFAYRVLDAQYFGLAQRRARVFVVGYLGNWRRAAAVLFERESLQGHPAPRREARERVAGTLTSSLGRRNGQPNDDNPADYLIAGSLNTSVARGTGQGNETDFLIAHSLRADGFDASEDGTGRGTPLVRMAFNWQSGGDARGLEPKAVTSALSRQQTPAVAFAQNQLGEVRAGDVFNTLNTNSNASGRNTPLLQAASAVRRLTPMECERLQGFPDNYTQVPYRGKPASDGPRYKALGNSMAVPVMRWIGERIDRVRRMDI